MLMATQPVSVAMVKSIIPKSSTLKYLQVPSNSLQYSSGANILNSDRTHDDVEMIMLMTTQTASVARVKMS
jgi:hypothetical protein